MNETKKPDINLVMNALNDYLAHLQKINTTSVDVQEFFNFMEPIFDKAGYRDNPQGGGAGAAKYPFADW